MIHGMWYWIVHSQRNCNQFNPNIRLNYHRLAHNEQVFCEGQEERINCCFRSGELQVSRCGSDEFAGCGRDRFTKIAAQWTHWCQFTLASKMDNGRILPLLQYVVSLAIIEAIETVCEAIEEIEADGQSRWCYYYAYRNSISPKGRSTVCIWITDTWTWQLLQYLRQKIGTETINRLQWHAQLYDRVLKTSVTVEDGSMRLLLSSVPIQKNQRSICQAIRGF